MLGEFANRHRHIIVLFVASVAIAAYVVPFSWGSVGQTQAQPSLYERLYDRVNEIKEINDKGLDDLKDRFDGNQ